MSEQAHQLQEKLQSRLSTVLGCGELQSLRRLSGGANMETWSFDWLVESADPLPMIMRRLPGNMKQVADMAQISLDQEAALLQVVYNYDVRVPKVHYVLQEADELGCGYIMQRIEGEALPFKLLADEKFNQARKTLAYEAGVELAQIHSIPVSELPTDLPNLDEEAFFVQLRKLIDNNGNVSPVHELAFHWLKANQSENTRKVLVHGDYRNGNLLVGEKGLTAVLDWELAHVGNPVQDIGYFCATVWRFGSSLPAGGFGSYDQLLDGYESISGWRPTLEEIQYWEVYAALLWGITCGIMLGMYRSGEDSGIERAAVGRRLTESEIDILLLMDKQGMEEQVMDKQENQGNTDGDSEQAAVPMPVESEALRASGTTGIDEMLQAVQAMLKTDVAPTQKGFTAYQLKIANNMLSIAQRELQYRDQLDELDSEIIKTLNIEIEPDKDASIKHQLALAIKSGRMGQSDLLSYLRRRAVLEMQINNPRYSSLSEAINRWI